MTIAGICSGKGREGGGGSFGKKDLFSTASQKKRGGGKKKGRNSSILQYRLRQGRGGGREGVSAEKRERGGEF